MQTLLVKEKLHCDAIAGMPRSGDQLAKALAGLLQKEFIILEWEGSDLHPTALKAPPSSEVHEVLLVDGLFDTAQSKLKALAVLGEAGIAVSDVMVLVDCEGSGYKELEANGCTLHSLFTITRLLNTYFDSGEITPEFRTETLRRLDYKT
ncbi:MAG: hypothetical protein ACHQU0_01795 [Candidatus Paceibacteria bacterium]